LAITVVWAGVFQGLHYALGSRPESYFKVFANLAIYAISLITIVLVDCLSREQVDQAKLLFICVVFSVNLTLLFCGKIDLASYTFNIIILFQVIYLLMYGVRVFKSAPPTLKNTAFVLLVGIIIGGPFWAITEILVLWNYIPYIADIALTTGYVILFITFTRETRMAYVLPFKALRLVVLDTLAGIPLFTHTWGKKDGMVDENLFSGMLQGITMIMQESVGRGFVNEIKLDDGVLLLRRALDHQLAFALISTRSSVALRHALEIFAGKFLGRFGDKLANRNDTGQFEPAAELVEECFQFIPEYAS
jgi:hypothetical protein